jgi:hypothetical protein
MMGDEWPRPGCRRQATFSVADHLPGCLSPRWTHVARPAGASSRCAGSGKQSGDDQHDAGGGLGHFHDILEGLPLTCVRAFDGNTSESIIVERVQL